MFSSKQVVQYNLFGSNVLEGISSCKFAHFPEEVFEISSEENQVIDSSESTIENLQQENFDLKQKVELHRHYKERAEEYYEEVSQLTEDKQTLEGKIKRLEVTMEKQERNARNIYEENERLEQQLAKLEGCLRNEVSIKNSTINLLNEELKDQKDEIHFMNITNQKLNKDLDQAETLINRLKDQSEEKEKQLEDLIKNLTDDNKYLQEVEYLRGDVNQEKLKNHDLIEELNRLQKENDDLKLKTLHFQPGKSLLDDFSEANIKADKFTQTENDYDKGAFSQESDLGYASFLDGIKPESSSEQKCLEPNRPLNLEKQDLTRELSTLQKENDDLKSKPLCFQTGMLLSDELSEVKIKADKFTHKEISYNRGSCHQEKINEAGKLLDKGYYSFSEQETELSTDQERSKKDKTLKRLLKKFKEEQVNNKYQLIKEYLCSSFERCSFTFRDCSLMDITEDTFDNLMRIWFVHRSNLIKSENEKKLNEELLSILSSTGNNYAKNLERFLLDNKDNQDLKTVLNLRRGESRLTVLHALSSVADKDKDYDNAVGLLLKAGADPNIHNDRGQTPLHCANGFNSIASLLKAGANPNQQDNQGKTPLHYAAKVGLDKESINLFLESRAKLNILDKQGKTPLDVAIDNDNKYIECFFTDNQKRLKKELSNELHFQGDSVGLTEGLKQFLHKHKND
ncbi:ankyrin repeat domain-containing protein [Wolbachia endosymbiont (group B) of Dolichovespula media]|nr:ankyrin repeat domain-containing protein [Wolbachia endosymbiont (group B) of Dolichovespula media]